MKRFQKMFFGLVFIGLISISVLCNAATWIDGMETDNSDIDWDKESVYNYDYETVFVNLRWKVKDIKTVYIQDVYIVRGEVAKVSYFRAYDLNGNLKGEKASNDILPFVNTPMQPMFNKIISYARANM